MQKKCTHIYKSSTHQFLKTCSNSWKKSGRIRAQKSKLVELLLWAMWGTRWARDRNRRSEQTLPLLVGRALCEGGRRKLDRWVTPIIWISNRCTAKHHLISRSCQPTDSEVIGTVKTGSVIWLAYHEKRSFRRPKQDTNND